MPLESPTLQGTGNPATLTAVASEVCDLPMLRKGEEYQGTPFPNTTLSGQAGEKEGLCSHPLGASRGGSHSMQAGSHEQNPSYASVTLVTSQEQGRDSHRGRKTHESEGQELKGQGSLAVTLPKERGIPWLLFSQKCHQD